MSPMRRFLSLVVCVSPLLPVGAGAQVPTAGPTQAQARANALSSQALALLDWTRQSGDHGSRPFVIIDKQHVRLWIFDANASHWGDTAVLLARGDHSVPGIGDKPMALIKPEERTTQAGRFRAEAGVNAKGEDIFWVDYDAAVSMHRVRAYVSAERRIQRLARATPEDNRISYGCINVPASFYDEVLRPAFTRAAGLVYGLPKTVPLSALFPLRKRP